MTSRLDRLFILLESGSSAVTRKAAAKQIGEVQKLHPHELHNLLNRLVIYLHSTSWDTRVAAAQAVDAILSNVPQWTPKTAAQNAETSTNFDSDRLTYDRFDIHKVLERGARLMGSEGTEFEYSDDIDMDSRESLQQQRTLLNERLGFNNMSTININDLVSLDDMRQIHVSEQSLIRNNESASDGMNQMLPVQEILRQTSVQKTSNDLSADSLSCREINRAKRKARQNPSVSANGVGLTILNVGSQAAQSLTATSCEEPDTKIIKLDTSCDISLSNDSVPDLTGSWSDSVEWPLETFCRRLYLDLFNPRWETRHGSATALRELIKAHSHGAGKCEGMTEDEMEQNHTYWLEDASLRLLCVLALDRFGDFISDQVMAPVRETCAQVLGTILKEMPAEKVHCTIAILLTLVKQSDWEVRHGGLLGIKYMLVVREDMLHTFLPLTLDTILGGLFDDVDDVGAVAASTLIPIAEWLPKLLSAKHLSGIVTMLWDLLLVQDELTSACNSFMGLLSAILSLPNASKWIQMKPMDVLIPRLWPFLSHTTSSVRRSTLQTLVTLTEITTTDHSQTNNDSTPNNSLKATNLNVNNQPDGKLENSRLDKVFNTDTDTLELNFGVKHWSPNLLQEALRHIYQRVLVEHISDIQLIVETVWNNLVTNAELSALLHASCPFVSAWICLAMQPTRLSFDPNQLIYTMPAKERKTKTNDQILSSNSNNPQQKMYLGGIETTPQDLRERNVPRARCKAAKMLGLLSRYLVLPAPGVVYTNEIESPINCYTKILVGYLSSRSALQRIISGMVVAYWAQCDSICAPRPPLLMDRLNLALMECVYYDEVAISLTRLLQEARDFLATLKQNKVVIGGEWDTSKILTLDQIQILATKLTENIRTRFSLKPKQADMLEDRRRGLHQMFTQTNYDQNSLNISTQAVLAGASVAMRNLPEKLNPVIKPIMESIKNEECETMQQQSAQYLVLLLDQVADRMPCPNNKIITNLCTLLKSDPDFTPPIMQSDKRVDPLVNNDATMACNPYNGILTLDNQHKSSGSQNGNNTSTRGPGRPPIVESTLLGLEETTSSDTNSVDKNKFRIQRMGATFTIQSICGYFGKDITSKLPILLEIVEKIKPLVTDELHLQNEVNFTVANELVTCLQLIEVIAPCVHHDIHPRLFNLLPTLMLLLRHPLKAIRHMCARCLATLAAIEPSSVMSVIVENGIVMLQNIERSIDRQGAAEAIACIVNKLQFKIVPYVILLVVPLLGRMSDPDTSVRLMSTNTFATLIQLMPLDGNSAQNTSLLTHDLLVRKAKDREFLEFLFTPMKIPDFRLPVTINAELRSYQQSGVNWLWFLNKYKLHGILCDDMGLGKTLQTICILAGTHYERQSSGEKPLASLVICPPTLTGHWVYEVNKFLSNRVLRPLHYVGLPADRERLRHQLETHNLVVASYDIVRKDIEFFGGNHWNYVVLDEGHVIKNGKTKSSKAIKCLIANHRLILSGTPIQNNVLELWSLFDFLMPGFLGTEKQFISKFSRPILASREPKSSAKDQEAGALAMESLHRQVLPFLLRRVKEDVLTDLPPKITQDLLCELSPLQERLYEDFSRSQMHMNIKGCLNKMDDQPGNINKKTHVFQALRYLQNVCNHPKLVLTAQHPEQTRIVQELARSNSSLDDIEHSAKLPALKQLLLDCGIGVVDDSMSVNQHRALIFCQLKAMLNIVENDLLKRHLPGVSYLRLDGSVPASTRHNIVTKFNNDPSIDVLLLTTQVGGLGLNLTGADTVIFVEHDWNPMKDLQAMDRAHRIGQRKVVNVYRLITRKSLEEKIMGLQKFKLITANTIVSDENATLETMQTDQIFNLFDYGDKPKGREDAPTISTNITMKQAIENLPELWEDRQYEEEYDIAQFLQNLKQ